ncbi:MAG: twin-arginine translocation signal domain-containing protein [Acidobacteria bacterium]|nr:twin-arginine translocation signal domain-containing protein [Acidobacteriota bacterium]
MAENTKERRNFLQQAAKAGGAAGLAAMAMAVPSEAAGGKIEKTPAGLKIGNLIFTSGLTGVSDGDFGGTIEEQTRATLEKHKKALAEAGTSLDNVLKVTVYMADIKVEKPAMNKVYGEFFTGAIKPSRSAIGIEFPDAKTKVEIDMIAWVP